LQPQINPNAKKTLPQHLANCFLKPEIHPWFNGNNSVRGCVFRHGDHLVANLENRKIDLQKMQIPSRVSFPNQSIRQQSIQIFRDPSFMLELIG
jgi:hypothetical protein